MPSPKRGIDRNVVGKEAKAGELDEKLPKTSSGDTVCHICSHHFPDTSSLKDHYLTHHRPVYTCSECGKDFSMKDSLKHHLATHIKNLTFTCVVCSKVFRSRNSYYSHRRLKHSPDPYPCGACPARFATPHRRRRHAAAAHRSAARPACAECARTFSDRAALRKHTRYIHEKDTTPCPLCSFASRPHLVRSHLVAKHGVGQHANSCQLCDRTFATAQGLKEHVRKHFGDRRFKCKLCNKRFLKKFCASQHAKLHVFYEEFSGKAESLIEIAPEPAGRRTTGVVNKEPTISECFDRADDTIVISDNDSDGGEIGPNTSEIAGNTECMAGGESHSDTDADYGKVNLSNIDGILITDIDKKLLDDVNWMLAD